jgi:hypothetical protein
VELSRACQPRSTSSQFFKFTGQFRRETTLNVTLLANECKARSCTTCYLHELSLIILPDGIPGVSVPVSYPTRYPATARMHHTSTLGTGRSGFARCLAPGHLAPFLIHEAAKVATRFC